MRRITILALIGVLFASLFAVLLPQKKADAAPIVCDGRAYMVRSNLIGSTRHSQLYEFKQDGTGGVNLNDMHNDPVGLTYGGVAVDDTSTFTSGFLLNGLAYNPADGYMYAALNGGSSSNEIVRIHDDGSLETVAVIPLVDGDLKGAGFTNTGTYYAISQGPSVTPRLYIVDGLDAASSGSQVTSTTAEYDLSTNVMMGDLAVDPDNGTVYLINNLNGRVYTIDVTDGTVTPIAASVTLGAGVTLGSNGFGSLFFTATGELRGYINDNGTGEGQLVKINTSNNNIYLVMQGPITADSDATSCVPVDFAIDTVKSAGTVTAQSFTEFTVPYTVKVTNNSAVEIPNVQLVDDLTRTFVAGSPAITVDYITLVDGPCTPSASYDGVTDIAMLEGSDSLDVGESCTLTFDVYLEYADAGDVPTDEQLNTVYASSIAGTEANPGHTFDENGEPVEPLSTLAQDISTDAVDTPTTPNGDTPTPTPVQLPDPNYALDVVKSAQSVTSASDTDHTVVYSIKVGNTGPTDAPNVQVNDNLAITFAAGSPTLTVEDSAVSEGPCTENESFNGISDTRLLNGQDTLDIGASCTILVTVRVVYPDRESVPTDAQNNTAYASTVADGPNDGYTFVDGSPNPPTDMLAGDESTDGLDLPDVAYGDTPTPTPVTFTLQAEELADTGIGMMQILVISLGAVIIGTATIAIRQRA